MNLLIVDDQPNVLAYLTSRIFWESAGIQEVFSASSVLAAKHIISSNKIDVLLTDIEMPVENGLDLVRWIRSNQYAIEIILLTSHSDFNYARQAIPLGVQDYVVQPAKDEDILQAVGKAVSSVREKESASHQDRFNRFSVQEINHVIRHFMNHWPKESNPGPDKDADYQRRMDQLKSLGLTYHEHDRCFLIAVSIIEWHTIPGTEADMITRYDMMTEKIFSYLNASVLSYITDDYAFISMLVTPAADDLETYLTLLNDEVRETFQCTSHIRYLETSFPEFGRAHAHLLHLLLSGDDSDSVIEKVLYRPPYGENKTYQRYYEQIRNYITNHITDPVTRNDIAEEIHVSVDYISRIVRAVEGISCIELIRNMKMDHARILVRTTDMPIGNIAVLCGFDSFAYFSRLYRSVHGVSPTQDRNNPT